MRDEVFLLLEKQKEASYHIFSNLQIKMGSYKSLKKVWILLINSVQTQPGLVDFPYSKSSPTCQIQNLQILVHMIKKDFILVMGVG